MGIPEEWVGSPTFKIPHRFEVVRSASGEYQFVSLTGSIRVRSRSSPDDAFESCLPLLRRGCDVNGLVEAIGAGRESEALEIVRTLSQWGVLEEVPPQPPLAMSDEERTWHSDQIKFFSNFQAFPEAPPSESDIETYQSNVSFQEKLKQSSVVLIGLGRVGSRLAVGFAHAGVGHLLAWDPTEVTAEDTRDCGLSHSDVGASRQSALGRAIAAVNPYGRYTGLAEEPFWNGATNHLPSNPDLLIVAEDQFDPERYAAINRFCLDRRIQWTSYRSFGLKYEVGPTIVPRETACFKCFEIRKAANLGAYDEASQKQLLSQGARLGSLSVTLGYEVLALETIKILTGFSRPMTYASLFSFDVLTLQAELHPVLKLPRCPHCSRSLSHRPTLSIWREGGDFDGL
jgi:molybdopterin-synthase adenylyltransferase